MPWLAHRLIAVLAGAALGAAGAAEASSGSLRQLLPGIVRPDRGTIEITAVFDRPMAEFGNDWEFLLQIVPGRSVGKGGNSLVAIFVPPLPETGLVALLRNGTMNWRAEAKDFTCTPGVPLNLAVSWGDRLTLWRDGVAIASTAIDAPPAEGLWPAAVEIARHAPFDPQGMRISSIERDAGTLDVSPADPFVPDLDTTLVIGPGMRDPVRHRSRWVRDSRYAVVKPVWRPESQCLRSGGPATFPVAVVNCAAVARTAHVAVTLTPLAGSAPITVRLPVTIQPASGPYKVELPLPSLASDWYDVAWSISGEGLPALSGTSSMAVYPGDPTPADGALAGFYAVHRPEGWPTEPFTRMGVTATRAWAQSIIFMWHRIEPTPGRFRWEEADAYVDSCEKGGLEVLAVLGYPSRWAASEPSAEHQRQHKLAARPARWKPADIQAWSRYVRAVAERYRGRVRHFEIYNEVNFCPPGLPAAFSGGTAEYLELQRSGWREIKAVDPGNLVLSSGFSASVNQRMPLDALGGGLADHCDIFNVHGYSGVEGTADWVADWRARRPGKPVWQTEQMWHRIADDRRRWWLTAALPVQYAADGFARFYNMGIRELFFDPVTLSPTRDQWVVAVMSNELRPCAYAGRAEGDGAARLDLHHRFNRSDGSCLTVAGSERGPMEVTLSAEPRRIRDLFGRPLRTSTVGGAIRLVVPDLAWMVSDSPLAILAAQPIGDAPLLVNAGFEQLDGDVDMAGLAAGTPRGYSLRKTTYDPEGAIRIGERSRTGRYAMELSSTGAGRVYLFQNAQVPEAGTYELSGWFRTASGNPLPYVFVFDQDGRHTHESTPVIATPGQEFVEFRLSVPLPERNTKPLSVGWGIRGTGTAILDDVAFAPARPRFDHHRFTALDLAPAGNLGLAGWAARLPDIGSADLATLAPGEHVFAGRSFLIGGSERAIVAVGGAGLPRRAALPLPGPVASLVFVHTALFVRAPAGQELGRYLITYADGSSAIHPIVNQRTIADWWPTTNADPAVPVATTVASSDRSGRNLYADRWTNPRPGVALREIAIEAAGTAAADPVILAIAISQEKP